MRGFGDSRKRIRLHCAAVALAGCALLSAPTAPAQTAPAAGSPAQPTTATAVPAHIPSTPAFEVAAIHQNAAGESARSHIVSSPFDGQFRTVNESLKGLIRWAYEMPEARIFGAPGWTGSTFFDIDAKADPALDEKLKPLSSDSGRQVKEEMVRSLLADRFKLTARRETRDMPIYALVVAKNGAKLGETKADGTTTDSSPGRIRVQGGNSLALLAEQLSRVSGRVVIDKTGISGRYHLNLKWTPDDLRAPSPGAQTAATLPPDSGPSLFTAIEEQLGLKLEPAKGPVEVLVVDHVEMPSEN